MRETNGKQDMGGFKRAGGTGRTGGGGNPQHIQIKQDTFSFYILYGEIYIIGQAQAWVSVETHLAYTPG